MTSDRQESWSGLVVDVRADGGLVTLLVRGELETLYGGRLGSAIDTALGGGVARLVVDVDGVTFIDSGGVWVLVGGWRAASEAGVGFRVSGAHGVVARTLHIVGVFEILTGQRRSAS